MNRDDYAVIISINSRAMLYYLYYSFVDSSLANDYLTKAKSFIFIETETDHVACCQMVIVEVFCQLSFASLIVAFASPYFKFHDILLSMIVNDDIGTCQITGLCFTIVIADTIDNGTKIGQEYFSPIIFNESVIMTSTKCLVEMYREPFYQQTHVKLSVSDKLNVVFPPPFGRFLMSVPRLQKSCITMFRIICTRQQRHLCYRKQS